MRLLVPHPEERACEICAGKVNWRARVSKDEDEPEPYSPSCFETHRSAAACGRMGARSAAMLLSMRARAAATVRSRCGG